MAFNDTINTGITPNDGQGDGLRTNIRKLHDNTKDNKQRLDDLNGNTPGVVSSNGISVLTPLDATFSLNGQQTGAIKIVLPPTVNDSMLKMSVELYDHGVDKSVTLNISGYNYNGINTWIETSVQTIASNSSRNYTVRFGYTGTNFCIYIAELNSIWQYPQVAITNFFVGFGGITPANWLTGWNISLETSIFHNITKTHTNNLPVAQ